MLSVLFPWPFSKDLQDLRYPYFTKCHLDFHAWTQAQNHFEILISLALIFGHLNNVLTSWYCLYCERDIYHLAPRHAWKLGTMSQKAVLHSSLFQQFSISRICTRSSLFYLPNSCRCNWHPRSEAELSEQQESNCCLQSCELERKNIWLWDQAGRERNRNLPLRFLRATLPASRSLNFKSPSKLSYN